MALSWANCQEQGTTVEKSLLSGKAGHEGGFPDRAVSLDGGRCALFLIDHRADPCREQKVDE